MHARDLEAAEAPRVVNGGVLRQVADHRCSSGTQGGPLHRPEHLTPHSRVPVPRAVRSNVRERRQVAPARQVEGLAHELPSVDVGPSCTAGGDHVSGLEAA